MTTFDIRMKEPNREPALGQGALHTIEHLAATFLRNHPVWADRILYWGPMGCLTGNYLLVKGDLASADIVELMKETFAFIASYEGDVPALRLATAATTCCRTFLWRGGSRLSSCMRCWSASPRPICIIQTVDVHIPFILRRIGSGDKVICRWAGFASQRF